MKLRLTNLWRWDGEISRLPFVVWAFVLLAIKYNLDRLLLAVVFDKSWSIFAYFGQPFPGIDSLSPATSPAQLGLLLAVGLPFLWMGIVLCLKRLRAARLPLWLALLFVVPILKWFLFVLLAIVPSRSVDSHNSKASRPRWLPKSRFGSAVLAVMLGALFVVLATLISTKFLREYGWGLFAGVPFGMGFLASVIHGASARRSLGQSITVAAMAICISGVALLAVALEGVICIVMAAPLALVLAVIGAAVGHVVVQESRLNGGPTYQLWVPVLAIPMMFGTEELRPETAPLIKVSTRIEINAPAEDVWRHVVAFSELPEPAELLFKVGIAFPIRAEITGTGPGATRLCVFSTGPFVEPIEVWEEPRLLKFSVTQNPAPMQEWTPYSEIHPPHLHGFLLSRQGQFKLSPLPGGRTMLEGTTWYEHGLWPAKYWQLWSDYIIHTIHLRVLNQIKHLTEEGEE